MPAISSIQQNTLSFNDTNTTHNVTITSVDTSRSIVMFTWRSTLTGNNNDRSWHKAYLTSGTNLRFISKSAAFARAITIEWTVIEFDTGVLVSLNSGSALTPASNPENITLGTTLTDATAAIPITSNWANGGSLAVGDFFNAVVTSTTNLRLVFGGTPSGMEVAWQLPEFDPAAVDVQSGEIALGSASPGPDGIVSNTATISSVDTSKALATKTGQYSASLSSVVMNRDLAEVFLTNGTTVTGKRADRATTANVTVGYAVIEFFDDTIVEQGEVTITNGNATPASQPSFTAMAAGAAWSGHNMPNAYGDPSDDGNPASRQASHAWDTTNHDKLTITRGGTGGSMTVAWNAIDWAGASGGGGFQAAWARGSNVILQPGVL